MTQEPAAATGSCDTIASPSVRRRTSMLSVSASGSYDPIACNEHRDLAVRVLSTPGGSTRTLCFVRKFVTYKL